MALEDAAAYVKSGLRKKVVVVAAEKMSSMVNYEDRATCPLFGDGAAAMLITPTEEPVGIIDGVFHVDGVGRDHLIMNAGGSVMPTTHETVDRGDNFLFQDGRFVYKHAVTDMLNATLEICERNNLTMESVDWLIPHQANLRIIEAVASRAGIGPREGARQHRIPRQHIGQRRFHCVSTRTNTASRRATVWC